MFYYSIWDMCASQIWTVSCNNVEEWMKFKVKAKSSNGIIQGIENIELKRYGCQFHPEGLLQTNIIIFNFIDICLNNK